MSKYDREYTLKQFRTGTFRVLISSNVTARGIDVQQVSTVINFDIPKDYLVYLHRIGRSGRHGRKGNAINFVTRYDVRLMQDIEKYYGTIITEFKQ
jgi:translation initiation factor 4A